MTRNIEKKNVKFVNIKKNIIYTIDQKVIHNYNSVFKPVYCISIDGFDKQKKFKLIPEDDLTYMTALDLEKIGNKNKAEELYSICLNNSYNHIDIFLRYIGILIQAHKYKEAINICNQGLKFYPNNSDLYNNLSWSFMMVDKLDKAIYYIQRSLSINADSALAYYLLSTIYRNKNDLQKANKYIDKAISIDSSNARYILELACIKRELGDRGNAYKLCLEAVELQPNFSSGYSILGILQRDLGFLVAAKNSLLKAIDLDPNDYSDYINLSAIYIDLGDIDNAEKIIRKSININSESPDSHINLASIFRDSGRIKEAKDSLETAINLKSNYAIAYYSLSILSGFSLNRKIYKYLFSDDILIGQSSLGLAHLYYARSNIKHKESKYKESSTYLTKANKYKSSIYKSESHSFIEKSNKLRKELSEINNIRRNIIKNQLNHIFIVGMPRSGSTLLESILSMNNNVFDLGEKNNLELSFIEWKKQSNLEYSLTDIYKRNIKYESMSAFISTDKWLFNYQYAGIIATLIPSAKIINCYRHPLDNILSIYRANFDNRGNHFSSSIEESARVYLDQEDTILNYKSEFPSNIYLLNYDELVLKPNSEIRKLIKWLDWDWNDLYLQPHLNRRNISTASAVEARSPINSKSLGGWKYYKDLLYPAIKILSQREKYKNIGILHKNYL